MGKERIKCKDCRCNIKDQCFRFPPIPHFVCNQWTVVRPRLGYDSDGCFAGIPKEQE
jgi:hypothetical protein